MRGSISEIKFRFIGDFTKIKAEQETFNLLSGWASKYKLLPNEFVIQTIDQNGKTGFERRVQFFDPKRRYHIDIQPDSLDFVYTQLNEDSKLDVGVCVEMAKEIIAELSSLIGVSANRMAFIIGTILINNSVNKFIKANIDEFKRDEFIEWSSRVVTREDITINNKYDKLNIVTAFNKTEFPHSININGSIKSFPGTKINYDINTIFKGNTQVYSSQDFKDFVGKAYGVYKRKLKAVNGLFYLPKQNHDGY